MESLNTIINTTLDRIDFRKVVEHPNILIAARFWEDERYDAARVIYKFMRYVDDMIDDRKALDEALSCMEKKMFTETVSKWIDCLGQDQSANDFFREVATTIRRFHIPFDLFYNFSRSMIFDIHNNGFSTFEEFLEYAEGASNGPASVFVHLCCLEKQDGKYIPPAFDIADVARPCAIFSYMVHIIRDFQKDQLNNLNYFPLDMLEKYGLVPEDLKEIALGKKEPGAFRDVIREYKSIAGNYRDDILKMLDILEERLEPRYFLSLKIIFHLYLKIFDRIDPAKGRFTSEELNPSPEEVRESVLECIKEYQEVNSFVI